MAGVEIQLDTRRLDALIATLGPRARRINERRALRVEADAKARAPVLTGNLRRSLRSWPHPTDRDAWVVGTNADYAGFVEFGTRRMSARPFFVPAVEAERARAGELLQELFR